MSIFSSLKRYIVTLGGLIGGDIDSRTDNLLSTPAGIKATFQQTRQSWTKQYAEVREAVAQLMMVLEQKRSAVEKLREKNEDLQVRMKGAVQKFKETNEPKYQQRFTELYNEQQALTAEQDKVDDEIRDLQGKVAQYKEKLNDMQKRIQDLKKQEADAIADIVSSKQIISLNDRLNNLSIQLDDRNLESVQERRESLKAQAKLSESLTETESAGADIDAELREAGQQNEAAEVFAAMLNEDNAREQASEQTKREREL